MEASVRLPNIATFFNSRRKLIQSLEITPPFTNFSGNLIFTVRTAWDETELFFRSHRLFWDSTTGSLHHQPDQVFVLKLAILKLWHSLPYRVFSPLLYEPYYCIVECCATRDRPTVCAEGDLVVSWRWKHGSPVAIVTTLSRQTLYMNNCCFFQPFEIPSMVPRYRSRHHGKKTGG